MSYDPNKGRNKRSVSRERAKSGALSIQVLIPDLADGSKCWRTTPKSASSTPYRPEDAQQGLECGDDGADGGRH